MNRGILFVVFTACAVSALAQERVMGSVGYESPDAWDVKPFYGQKMYLSGFGSDAADAKAQAAMSEKAMFRNVWFDLSGPLSAAKRPIRITDTLETPEWKRRWEYCCEFMNDHPTALVSFGLTGSRPVSRLPETSDMHRDDFVIWKWSNPRFAGFTVFDDYDAEMRACLQRKCPPSDIRAWTDRNFKKLKSYCFKLADLSGSWSDLPMTGFDLARAGVKYLRYNASGAGRTGGMYARGASRQFDVPFGWCVDGTDRSRSQVKCALAYGAFIGCSSLSLADGLRSLYADGGTRLSPSGEDVDAVFAWAHGTDRGKCYTPVALLVPLNARPSSLNPRLALSCELADVVALDAGQDDAALSEVLSHYKAAVLVEPDARAIDASKIPCKLYRPGGPKEMDGLLAALQDELMPVTVEGDVRWGVNRTKTGWLVWLINDGAKDAAVTLGLKTTGERRAVTVGPGDWATVAFADAPAQPKPREIMLSDWEFSHDRKVWTSVRVPHDWAIAEPFDINIDAQDVAVVEDGESEVSRRIGRTGALPWIGEGWYRRHLTIPDGVRAAELWFDGAMANAEVFANGTPVGGWRYGYTPFVVKLPKEKEIDVLVHLRTMPQSSRWYPGAGLYRKVTLRLDPQSSVEDVFVRTERIEDGKAYLRVSGPNGDRTFVVKNPRLWTPEDPHLYTLEPEGIRYGIRTVEWKDGTFRLNGKVRKFRGVCLHHDLGPIGAAFSPAAFRRQVRLLKEIGCDAIRTAHNIPCSEQLDICDEMGMMVMAESFDEWEKRKCRYGYHDDFKDWWRADLEALIRFHRNHPSVVMWSIGNEIPDQVTQAGTQIARAMTGILHWFDPTRPVTQGHSSMPYAIEAGGVQEMDIPGVTYRLRFYDQLHAASKYGGVLGAETASTMSSRGWYAFPDEPGVDVRHSESMQASSYDLECGSWSNLPDDDFATQDDNPWTMGEFVWTGFDYLGEPAPYDADRSRSSYFGIYDLAGLPKDRAYLYRARWRTDVPTLHVLPHWTWPDRVGKVTPVYVYTSYPEAELFINGRSQGRKTFDKTSRLDRYRLRWRDVVYEPGELKVIAYGKDGQVAETKVVRTAGAPHHLVLTPDRTQLTGARDLAFVTVDVVDRDGNLCPHAANRVTFKVTGAGSFKAACNGDATDLDTLSQPTMKAFNGRLVAVVAARDDSGEIELVAKTEGLPAASVRLCNLLEDDKK